MDAQKRPFPDFATFWSFINSILFCLFGRIFTVMPLSSGRHENSGLCETFARDGTLQDHCCTSQNRKKARHELLHPFTGSDSLRYSQYQKMKNAPHNLKCRTTNEKLTEKYTRMLGVGRYLASSNTKSSHVFELAHLP